MKRSYVSWTFIVLMALAVGVVFGEKRSNTKAAWAENLATQSDEVADIVEKALPSVVNVSTTRIVNTGSSPIGSFGNRGERQLGKSLGSGVVVSSKGYVLTNNHVIDGARDIMIGFSDGRELAAKLVGADPNSDLAVLKLVGKGATVDLVPIRLGSSTKMRLGETVLAIGNPFGVGQTVTMGIVSAKGRANMGILDYEDFIQTDAAINPGNSGGALVNLKGELIGINTAILSRTGGSQGIGFAIPSDIARPIMKSLIDNGRVNRGYLGVNIQTVTDDLAATLKLGADRGVLISDVKSDSPADKVGLKKSDVVVSINGDKTETAAHFRTTIASLGAGSEVALKVARTSGVVSVKVKLDELPGAKEPAVDKESGGSGKATSFGVTLAPVSKSLKRKYDLPAELERGVVVTGVAESSRASEIGLQPGDVILEVNRAEVSSAKQFQAAFAKSGARLALLVYRDGSAIYVVVSK